MFTHESKSERVEVSKLKNLSFLNLLSCCLLHLQMTYGTRAQQYLRWAIVTIIDMGRKEGAAVRLSQGELGLRLTQCGLGRGLLPYEVASSSIQPFGHNRHGPKIGWGCAIFLAGGAGSPSNTRSPGPRPTSIPSGILVHLAVFPQ